MLLKQDKTEAVMAVNGRLEYIDKEMWVYQSLMFGQKLIRASKRIEKQIKEIQEKAESVKTEVCCKIMLGIYEPGLTRADRQNPVFGTTVPTSGSSMRVNVQNNDEMRYPCQQSVVQHGWTDMDGYEREVPFICSKAW